MRAKHVSKFFFFTAPNYSEVLNYGDPKDIIHFKEIEEKISNEKRKVNFDKKKLRKMRLKRTVFKKKIIENFTYCPYDVYIAINKSSLPPKPQVLDGIRHLLYFSTPSWDYKKEDVEFLTLMSEGEVFLSYLQSPKRLPTPLAVYEDITRNNDTNQKMSSEQKKVQRIARAVQKSRTFLEQPNVYKISLTTSEKLDLCYYFGKGRPKYKDIIHSYRQDFLDEFSFWPKFLGSQIGLKKSIFIGENRTGLGYYHFHEKRLWLSEERELTLKKEKTPKENTRSRIPDDVQIFVWNRDEGICVKCGSDENLAFDHIIPHSLGGSDTKRNLQILCDTCNQKKGNKIGG
jgi:hypothetical protein